MVKGNQEDLLIQETSYMKLEIINLIYKQSMKLGYSLDQVIVQADKIYNWCLQK